MDVTEPRPLKGVIHGHFLSSWDAPYISSRETTMKKAQVLSEGVLCKQEQGAP